MQAQARDTRTLEQALRETAQRRWQGRRCYATNLSQAEAAIRGVERHTRRRLHLSPGATLPASQVSPADIREATAVWYASGLSPATINKRLNCLSAMGVSVEGCRVREPKVLKWWLKPEDEERVSRWLWDRSAETRGGRDVDPTHYDTAEDLIYVVCRTGFRIEEALRLTGGDLSGEFPGAGAVTVPGLKTTSSQATLPVTIEVGYRLECLRDAYGRGPLFPISYDELKAVWVKVRSAFGWQDNPTATLKALRRSAARHLHITKGMPLDMVRQYLRHEDIETTMGYLRLTGGYGTEEMRKWL